MNEPTDLSTPEPDDLPDLAYQVANTDLYLDERYRQIAALIRLYILYSEPTTSYNQVIGALGDEMNNLVLLR